MKRLGHSLPCESYKLFVDVQLDGDASTTTKDRSYHPHYLELLGP